MRSAVFYVSVAVLGWAMASFAQEPSTKEEPKTKAIKATYLIKGLH